MKGVQTLYFRSYPSEEGDVEKRRIAVGELESEEFDDQSIVILGLRPVVLC
jgi:hypothetical protein